MIDELENSCGSPNVDLTNNETELSIISVNENELKNIPDQNEPSKSLLNTVSGDPPLFYGR